MVVGHTRWGTDKVVFLGFCHVIVHSKMDCECIVCNTKSMLVLRTSKSRSPCICLGIFCTFPVLSSFIKAGEICVTSLMDESGEELCLKTPYFC